MTAVEYLIEELEADYSKIARIIGLKKYNSIIQQAKEIEKQQRTYAYDYGKEDVFDWLKKMDYDFLVEEFKSE